MDELAVREACARFVLNRAPKRGLGALGALAGRGTGSSLDFHDFRAYMPGDDLRGVDWSVYGRTGELVVRLWRREIQPELDVLLDVSRSMGLDDGHKPERARELAAFALQSARLQGSRARLHLAGSTLERADTPLDARFDAAECALQTRPGHCALGLPAGGVRWLISDFASGQPPGPCIRELSRSAGQLVAVRLLGPWEAAPTAHAALSLIDSETGQQLPTALTRRTLERYLARQRALAEELRRSCQAVGALCVEVVCDATLTALLRRDLLPAGAVLPA